MRPPQLTAAVDDLVLQLRHRQPAVDQSRSRFTLHRRFGATIRVLDQASHGDDAAPSLMFADDNVKLQACTRSAAQCGVEHRQRTRTSERTRDLYRRPRGRRRQSSFDASQRRADSVDAPSESSSAHANSRIENMDSAVIFGIKSVQSCGCGHARHDRLAGRQIQSRESCRPCSADSMRRDHATRGQSPRSSRGRKPSWAT